MKIVYALPENPQLMLSGLPLHPLGRVLDNTTNSYKFWWFSALLELHCRQYGQTLTESCDNDSKSSPTNLAQGAWLSDQQTNLLQPSVLTASSLERLRQLLLKSPSFSPQPIFFRDLAAMMVAKAWYSHHYFRLRFGLQDKLPQLMQTLITDGAALTDGTLQLSVLSHEKSVYTSLSQTAATFPKIKKMLLQITDDVAYRLLSPWIRFHSNQQVIEESTKHPGVLYQIVSNDGDPYILIKPVWQDYLLENCGVLQNFIDLALATYLQKKNPAVPNIISKLKRPAQRESLDSAKAYFEAFKRQSGQLECIYTGQILTDSSYAIDHFIPWSFVAHDEIWNLAPIDKSSNSSKSDRLPDPEFIPRLAMLHYQALQANYKLLQTANNQKEFNLAAAALHIPAKRTAFLKAGESLTTGLNADLDELYQLSDTAFCDHLKRAVLPLHLQARSMNFEIWQLNPSPTLV